MHLMLTKRVVKVAEYWPNLFSSRSRKTQKEQGQFPAISTAQAWSIKDLLYGKKEDLFLRDQRGKSRAGKVGRLANQNSGFASSCLLAASAIQ